MEFTKASIAGLAVPAGKAELIVWDDSVPGFGCRVRGGGARTWIVQYRINGRQRRESLGDVRKVDLADARKIARQRFAKVELGHDPRAETKPGITVAQAAKVYLAYKRDKVRPGTFQQAEMHLTRYWKPLAGLALDQVTRADVAGALQTIIKDHGRTAAARARSNLGTLYGWAMGEALCEANPVMHTNNPAEGIPSRERVLSDDELAAVWRACLDDDFGKIVKLLAVTGCRREEIGQLRWDEVDLAAGTITIPGTRTKNHRTLTLPLPPLALDILKSCERTGDHVFGGEHSLRGFNAYSWGKLRLDSDVTTARGGALPRWTLHDVRRTMRTGLGRLGIAPHVAELTDQSCKGGVQANLRSVHISTADRCCARGLGRAHRTAGHRREAR